MNTLDTILLLALAAVATFFRYGAALDTQTAALRRDAEGLV